MRLLDSLRGSRRSSARAAQVRTGLGGTGLPSARERFERRAAAARRRPRLIAGLALALVVLVGGLFWLGWYSSLATADRVQVEGVAGSAAVEVEKVADVPLGTPIMRVDTGGVADRLISHRAYSSVSVSRSLPHTIVISVTPRVAVLAAKNPKGQVELVDKYGMSFRIVAEAPKGIPLVTAGSEQVTAAGLTGAIRALAALDPKTRAGVSSVTVGASDQVSFILSTKAGRRTVIWGGAGEEQVKSRLVAILTTEPGTVIDVSVPNSPVTR